MNVANHLLAFIEIITPFDVQSHINIFKVVSIEGLLSAQSANNVIENHKSCFGGIYINVDNLAISWEKLIEEKIILNKSVEEAILLEILKL